MKENKINISKNNILISFLSAILIMIFHNLKIDWYLKNIIIPFSVLLLSNIAIYEDNKDINKKAYFMLIPITLILISDVVIGIDISNKIINVFLLPVLISMFFFLLVNKNYKISFNNLSLVFKLFPNSLFSNLKFLKPNFSNEKNKKMANVALGVGIGLMLSTIIFGLLVSADDYFDAFMNNIIFSFDLDIGSIIILAISFIVLFSVSINIAKNKYIDMKETSYKVIDNTIIVTVLSFVNFVFVLFLVSEISKLCGNFLQIPKGYIYSSYAREGFFQLLFVTLINYSIIAFLMYKTKNIEQSKVTKYLILILVGFSVLLIFNSYYRMYLYIKQFGFTILRLQVILFLAMELILFGIISKKILKGLKNDGIIFFIILTLFYIINLYVCNDLFIKLINK